MNTHLSCPHCRQLLTNANIFDDANKLGHMYYTCSNPLCPIAAITTYPEDRVVQYDDNTPNIYCTKPPVPPPPTNEVLCPMCHQPLFRANDHLYCHTRNCKVRMISLRPKVPQIHFYTEAQNAKRAAVNLPRHALSDVHKKPVPFKHICNNCLHPTKYDRTVSAFICPQCSTKHTATSF